MARANKTAEDVKPEVKPRILVVENSLYVTGSLKSAIINAEHLRNEFTFVFLIPKQSAVAGFISSKGFPVRTLPFLEISRNWKNLLAYVPVLFMNAIRFLKVVREEKIDIIHVNDFYNLVPALARLLGSKAPLICHIRFMPDRFPSVLVKIWYGLYSKMAVNIIAVSTAVVRQLTEKEHVVVIADPLPTQRTEPKIIEQKPEVRLLYLAHYIPGKGQNFAIAAFKNAIQAGVKARLRFVGSHFDDPKFLDYFKSLVQAAKEKRIDQLIEWGSFTLDVEKEIKEADIVLNFSESESFSMTCLESLYFGTPVIATDSGGPSGIIQNNKTGWLVPNRDVNAMSKAIIDVAQNWVLRADVSRNAYLYVLEKYKPANTTGILGAIYQNALTKWKKPENERR